MRALTTSERVLDAIRREFPDFRLVRKRASAFSKAIDVALRIVTFGAQRQYLTHYHTVIGSTLYLPESWEATPDVDRAIVLRHELVHLRQRRRLGLVPMALLYLLPYFPLGLAWGRARLEWEAYRETVRATAELKGMEVARSAELRGRIVGRFTSGAYGWMWPFRRTIERWYDELLNELSAEHEEHSPRVSPAPA
jgi:hypothetical protein